MRGVRGVRGVLGVAVLTGALLPAGAACADGGAVIAARQAARPGARPGERPDARPGEAPVERGGAAVLLLDPATPRPGAAHLTLVAPGLPADTEVRFRAWPAGRPADAVQVVGRPAADTAGTWGSAVALDAPGAWEVSVEAGPRTDAGAGAGTRADAGRDAFRLQGAFAVSPPIPEWMQEWPWLFSWVPLTAVLLLREIIVRGRAGTIR